MIYLTKDNVHKSLQSKDTSLADFGLTKEEIGDAYYKIYTGPLAPDELAICKDKGISPFNKERGRFDFCEFLLVMHACHALNFTDEERSKINQSIVNITSDVFKELNKNSILKIRKDWENDLFVIERELLSIISLLTTKIKTGTNKFNVWYTPLKDLVTEWFMTYGVLNNINSKLL